MLLVVNTLRLELLLLLLLLVLPLLPRVASVAAAAPHCVSARDCSLAGACSRDGASCLCDGWTHGARCEVLNLLPVETVEAVEAVETELDHESVHHRHARLGSRNLHLNHSGLGYNNSWGGAALDRESVHHHRHARLGYRNRSGYNSWGGAALPFGGKWYLFASQMAGKCPLLGWWSLVSEVVRGVADTPSGPYRDVSTIVPSFAHNAKPFLHPDGTWLIFYVGRENNQTHLCAKDGAGAAAPVPPLGTRDLPPPGRRTAGPIMVAAASRPDAPAEDWEHFGPLTDSYEWHSATNPSPVFFENGTVLLAVSRWFLATGSYLTGKRTVLMRSDSWKGPYRNISATATAGGSLPTGEDPDLFRTPRGFHMLNHNTGAASTRLWFSEDGVTGWQESQGENAFNATVSFDNGTAIKVCQRQRPQIVFADDGLPGWFWSGVMLPLDGICPQNDLHPAKNPTYTLVQQIGRSGGVGPSGENEKT